MNLLKLFVKKNKAAFIHIPKTGGTYLGQRETNKNTPVISPLKFLGHTCIVRNNPSRVYPPTVGFSSNCITSYDILRDHVILSTVRNIFSWLVSYYHHAGGGRTKYIDERHYDYFKAQKGFEYLLKTIAERDRNTWPNRQFIFFQIFDDEGNLTVNWLNRTNTLDNDLKKFAMKFGFDFTKKGKQRIGHNEDYRSFYTSELVDLVKTTWKRAKNIRVFF